MTMSEYCLDVDSLSKLYRVYKIRDNPFSRLWKKVKHQVRGQKLVGYRPVREVLALDDVSFKIQHGEAVGIIGPNGAGKSTLLKILARVSFPTKGTVRGRGRVIPLLEAGTGFNKNLTARENIFLSGAMFGIPDAVIRRRMDTILEWAEVERFADMPLGKFSSGMYIRLAFSVAINLEPDILLADEILSVGDLKFQGRCKERIAELSKRGMTLLFVSHDMQAIREITGRVLFFVQGRLIDHGDPEEMIVAYEQYAMQQTRVRRITRDETMARNEFTMIHQPEATSLDKDVKGILSINEDFWIKIPFDVYQRGLKYAVNIDLYHRGIVILGTRTTPFTAERDGLYVCWVKIPARLLVDDVYTVNISVFCQEDDHWHVAKLHNAINLTLVDPEDRFYRIREYGLPSPKHWVVDPRLEVEYEYVAELNKQLEVAW